MRDKTPSSDPLYKLRSNISTTAAKSSDPITSVPFGKTVEGQLVTQFTLKNREGLDIDILDYGGTIVSFRVPDRNDHFQDVVLGFDTVAQYEASTAYFGALIGRYANRIAEGQFELEGTRYELATNDGSNHLHGGERGFDRRIWDTMPVMTPYGPGLELTYVSVNGEEGYPGRISTRILYVLTHENELVVDYKATTSKKTILNLTQHTYFNLSGHDEDNILGHELLLNAEQFTPVEKTLIPSGELRPVHGTPFDFTKRTRIGARINAENQQLQYGLGYDHNYVLSRPSDSDTVDMAASISDVNSGRTLTLYTTEPGLQFYSGNLIDDNTAGKSGATYGPRSGFALEPQHFPNSPNESSFPSTTLRQGETYHSRSIYRFDTDTA